MKVFYQTNIPSPYRMAFLNELGKLCDLTVAFEGNNASDRDDSWFTEKAEHFHCIFMKGRQVSSDQFFCPEVVQLLRQKWDKIILCGYAGPTTMLGIDYLRLHRIPFYMELDGGLIKQESRFKYLVKRHFASAAKVWFSSGEATTKWISHYGADPARCYRYPFTSLLNADLLSAVQLQEADAPEAISPFPDTSFADIQAGWDPEAYILRREQIRQCARKRMGITAHDVIVSVGQIIPRKGFDTLLQAMAGLPRDIALYIVGGNATEELNALVEANGLTNVHFVPFQNKQALQMFYQAADLFVLATREDIWGLVINEAMAQGLPVITTRSCVAGVELVEEDKNGCLTDAEDASGLADKISRLLSSPRQRQEFGAVGYRKMFGCTIEQMAARHFEILQNT